MQHLAYNLMEVVASQNLRYTYKPYIPKPIASDLTQKLQCKCGDSQQCMLYSVIAHSVAAALQQCHSCAIAVLTNLFLKPINCVLILDVNSDCGVYQHAGGDSAELSE